MDISKIVVGLNIMILYFQLTYGSITSFLPIGQVNVNAEFRISCIIDPFAAGADATLNRNGSLLNTCFQDGVCTTGDTKTINGAQFSFTGDSEGIHLTIDHLPQSEVGLLYVCVKDGSVNYTVVESSSGSGGGSTDWTWLEIFFTVVGVLGALAIIGIIIKFCCTYNTRCKGQGSRVNFTSNGRIENLIPKIEPDKKEVTPNQGGIENLIPKIEPDKKEVTPNQGRIENLIPKIEPDKKEVTPNQEINSIDKLNKGRSSIAASQPRSGAHQPLNPLIRADGGNRIEKIYQDDETKYDESKKTKREEK